MIIRAHKICNKCEEVVARKACIGYVTVKEYVTVRGDDVARYYCDGANTIPYKLHYCHSCWKSFVRNIEVDY